MSARAWVYLVFRLLAIYFLANFVVALPVSLSAFTSTAALSAEAGLPTWYWVLMSIATVLQGVLGYFMLTHTGWFADRAMRGVAVAKERRDREIERQRELAAEIATGVPAGADAEGADALSAETESEPLLVNDLPHLGREDVFSLAVSIIGAWVLVAALPELMQILLNMYRMYRTSGQSMFMDEFIMSWMFNPSGSLLAVILRALLGAWLFLSPYGVVRLWSRRQQAAATE